MREILKKLCVLVCLSIAVSCGEPQRILTDNNRLQFIKDNSFKSIYLLVKSYEDEKPFEFSFSINGKKQNNEILNSEFIMFDFQAKEFLEIVNSMSVDSPIGNSNMLGIGKLLVMIKYEENDIYLSFDSHSWFFIKKNAQNNLFSDIVYKYSPNLDSVKFHNTILMISIYGVCKRKPHLPEWWHNDLKLYLNSRLTDENIKESLWLSLLSGYIEFVYHEKLRMPQSKFEDKVYVKELISFLKKKNNRITFQDYLKISGIVKHAESEAPDNPTKLPLSQKVLGTASDQDTKTVRTKEDKTTEPQPENDK